MDRLVINIVNYRIIGFLARVVTILTISLGLLFPQISFATEHEKYEGVLMINPGTDLWRDIRQRDVPLVGTSQIEGVDTGILINSQGDRWARFRVNDMVNYGTIALVVVLLLLLLFYFVRGKIRVEGGLSGRMLFRFTDYERLVHWSLAILFVFLAVTGLILLLGRTFLIPLIGQEIFSLLASASKESHNLFGPIFIVSLLMMLFAFVKRNIYQSGDINWLIRGGGLIGKNHVSGGFFNMGEKIWYWIVILIGFAISISGVILVSPNFGQGRLIMELSHVVHGLGAITLIALALGHIYLSFVAVEGVTEGMKTGYVDLNWAEAHHDLWAKDCEAKDLIISPQEYARLQGKPATDLTASAAQE